MVDRMMLANAFSDLTIVISFTPTGMREYRGSVLMAARTKNPISVLNQGSFSFCVVSYDLKFETTELLVIADNFDNIGFFLVTQK